MKRNSTRTIHLVLCMSLLGYLQAARAQSVNEDFKTIDYPGAHQTTSLAINSQGDIAGNYTLSGSVHGFLLTGDKFSTLDVPGSTRTLANCINSQGDIVGHYILDDVFHGFLLIGGEFTTIDVPGARATYAKRICREA